MSNEQVETPAEFCEWLVSMNALSNVGSRGLVTLSNIIERADLVLRAANHAPQVVDSTCTCPSGDGSLRWPCPQHPPTPQADVLAEVRAADKTWRKNANGNAAFRRAVLAILDGKGRPDDA